MMPFRHEVLDLVVKQHVESFEAIRPAMHRYCLIAVLHGHLPNVKSKELKQGLNDPKSFLIYLRCVPLIPTQLVTEPQLAAAVAKHEHVLVPAVGAGVVNLPATGDSLQSSVFPTQPDVIELANQDHADAFHYYLL